MTAKFLREEGPPMLSDGTLRGIKPHPYGEGSGPLVGGCVHVR
jgi:hypothetical protein